MERLPDRSSAVPQFSAILSHSYGYRLSGRIMIKKQVLRTDLPTLFPDMEEIAADPHQADRVSALHSDGSLLS